MDIMKTEPAHKSRNSDGKTAAITGADTGEWNESLAELRKNLDAARAMKLRREGGDAPAHLKPVVLKPGTSPPNGGSDRAIADRLKKLNERIDERKAKTPWITNPERQNMVRMCEQFLKNTSPSESQELLRELYESSMYMAAAGNFESFCVDILGLQSADAAAIIQLAERSGTGTRAPNDAQVPIAQQMIPEAPEVEVNTQSQPPKAPAKAITSGGHPDMAYNMSEPPGAAKPPPPANSAGIAVQKPASHSADTPTAVDSPTPIARSPKRKISAGIKPQPSTAAVTPELLKETMPQYWLSRINEHLAAGVQSMVEAGTDLVAAKAKLGHGGFQSLFEPGKLRIEQRSAEMLMRIARNCTLANPNNYSILPPTLNALHALSKVDAARLQTAIDAETVFPEMKVTDARLLADSLRDKEKPCMASLSEEAGAEYGKREHAAACARIKTLLDEEFGRCPYATWRKRLREKVILMLNNKWG